MKINSNLGEIRSIQKGRFIPSDAGVTILHDEVRVNKSELIFRGVQASYPGFGVSCEGAGKYFPNSENLTREEGQFIHVATHADVDRAVMYTDTGSANDVVASEIEWELIEYA